MATDYDAPRRNETDGMAEGSLDELKASQVQMLHLERLGTMGQLAAGISHDVRNVMVSLRAVEWSRHVRTGSGLWLAEAAQFTLEDEVLCDQLALVGGAALQRARLHEAERDAVRRLQVYLLPRELLTQADLQLAVRYLPANAIAEIGGDWYDVFTVGGGRLAAVVGDVVGHGMDAAATMSALRSVLRAYLLEGADAGQALRRIHELATRTGLGLTATFCCVIIDPGTGLGHWASAGHPPPLLVGADERADYLDPGGRQQPALGVGRRVSAAQTPISLGSGETLLLYTDGLIDRRDGSDGSEALRAVAGQAWNDLDAYCDRLIDVLAPARGRRDDVALLALHRSADRESVLELRPLAQPTAGAYVRRRMEPWLAARGFDHERIGDVLVAVNEAVADAVEHSGISVQEQITVRAQLDGAELRITVRDTGRWRPAHERGLRGYGLSLMRALSETVSIDRRDDGTRVELALAAGPREPHWSQV